MTDTALVPNIFSLSSDNWTQTKIPHFPVSSDPGVFVVPVLEYIAERRAFRKQDRDMTHAAHTGCAEKNSSKASWSYQLGSYLI